MDRYATYDDRVRRVKQIKNIVWKEGHIQQDERGKQHKKSWEDSC